MFLNCIREFTDEERKYFIEFTTGIDTLPNNQNITILIYNNEEGFDQMWPVSHVCFYRLDLPLFSTCEKMMHALRYIIYNVRTFEYS